MLIAIVPYGAACVAITHVPGDAADDVETLRYGFTAAAIISGAVSMWWRHRFLALEGSTLSLNELRGHAVWVWALSEAVAICGLVLAVLTHAANEFVPFALAAGALMILHRPANLPFARLRDPIG